MPARVLYVVICDRQWKRYETDENASTKETEECGHNRPPMALTTTILGNLSRGFIVSFLWEL